MLRRYLDLLEETAVCKGLYGNQGWHQLGAHSSTFSIIFREVACWVLWVFWLCGFALKDDFSTAFVDSPWVKEGICAHRGCQRDQQQMELAHELI